ncbi:MAG TPA: L-threonylcarbamoyladenylate synthase [Pyrinomonadaceae bacterium]|jgi:L-threonylcarbamoyladenylate synthase|nr:L-threonylcarbamoyladenylate synthase [Pyrinomonadaceae bacterium]
MSIRPDTEETREDAARVVASGGVIAFRTDTFYGLGANPRNAKAVQRIRAIKGRDDGKPILLLIGELAEVKSLTAFEPPLFRVIANQLWPGPLTIVLPAIGALPNEVTAGSGSIGLRLPDHDGLRELLMTCGGVLTATSANPSGSEPATSALQVVEYFPRGIDLIIDGGVVTATQPSTVIDVTCEPPRIIREGAVTRAELEEISGLRFQI